jgi:hypothetical protein
MSSLDPHYHAIRRRRVMKPYLRGQLQTSQRLHGIMVTVLRDRLMPRLVAVSRLKRRRGRRYVSLPCHSHGRSEWLCVWTRDHPRLDS